MDTVVASSSQGAHAQGGQDTAYFEHLRPEMLEFVPNSAQRVLDVGCGSGAFAATIKVRQDCTVWGVEAHPDAARRAVERLDNVIVGQVPDAFDVLANERFDCIVFNDVLEHLVDPYSALQRVKSILLPGGVVVCSIPNVREFDNLRKLVLGKQWRYEDAGILDRTHLRFFTEASIRDMFADGGYHIQKMHGINRTRRRLRRLLNTALFGALSDTLYLQFACRAVPINDRCG